MHELYWFINLIKSLDWSWHVWMFSYEIKHWDFVYLLEHLKYWSSETIFMLNSEVGTIFFFWQKFLWLYVCNIMSVWAYRRERVRSHFLKQPLAPCLGTTRHKILADDKISMFQQRPLLRKCLSDGIFTSYFEWKENTKAVYFGSLVNNKEKKNEYLLWNSDC